MVNNQVLLKTVIQFGDGGYGFNKALLEGPPSDGSRALGVRWPIFYGVFAAFAAAPLLFLGNEGQRGTPSKAITSRDFDADVMDFLVEKHLLSPRRI